MDPSVKKSNSDGFEAVSFQRLDTETQDPAFQGSWMERNKLKIVLAVVGVGVVVAIAAILGVVLGKPGEAKHINNRGVKPDSTTEKSVLSTPSPTPGRPKLSITNKVTLTIGNKDGDTVGTIEIGLFGTRLPKTAENFIALTNGEWKGEKLNYHYVDSRFNKVIVKPKYDFYVEGGDDVRENGNSGGYSIYDGGDFDNRYWAKDQNDPKLTWEDVTDKNTLFHCCKRKGWVAMSDVSTNKKENNPAYNSKFKIYTDDVTWTDEETEKDLVFGKVLNDDGIKLVNTLYEKCEHQCRIKNAVSTTVSEEIEKPEDLVIENDK